MVMVLIMAAIIQFAFVDEKVDATSDPPGSTVAIPHGIDYLYVIKQNTGGTNIQAVDAYENDGDKITKKDSTYRSGNTMGEYWTFDSETGMGPFNSFYAAINISTGVNDDDNGERRLSTVSGKVAYVLDPNNLKKTLNGHPFLTDQYNVMLIIPTVYWKSVTSGGSNYLYLSNSPEFGSGTAVDVYSIGGKITDMKAYAHTLKSENTEDTYPYIALGVYEANIESGKLCSKSGKTSAAASAVSNYSFEGKNASSEYGTYQVWNFYQWTLYKMMGYTVMGTKNAQYIIGKGSDIQQTGMMDDKSPYYGSVKTIGQSVSGSKLFLENAWGSRAEYVTDVYFKSNNGGESLKYLYIGNNLGGNHPSSLNQTKTNSQIPNTGSTKESTCWIAGASTLSEYWDLPVSVSESELSSAEYHNSKMANSSRWNGASDLYALFVGGGGMGTTNTTWGYRADASFGTRISYVMNLDAIEVNVDVKQPTGGKVYINGTEVTETTSQTFERTPTYTVITTSMVISYTESGVSKEMTITAIPDSTANPFQGFVDEAGNRITGTNEPLGGMGITALFGPNKVIIQNIGGGELRERLFSTGVVDNSVFHVSGNTLSITTETTTSMIVRASDGAGTFGQFAVIKSNSDLITSIDGMSFSQLLTEAGTGDHINLTAIFLNKVFFYRGDAYTITTSNPGYTTSSIGGEQLFLVPYGSTPAITSTLNSGHENMKFYAGISEITGVSGVYTMPAVTSDTYITILADGNSTVTFSDDNAQYETDHTLGRAMIPTYVKISPKVDSTITYPMLLTVSGRTWMSMAVFQTIDVKLDCTTSEKILITNQSLNLFQGLNGSLEIFTKHGSAKIPSSDVSKLVSAIIGMSPGTTGNMDVGIIVTEPPVSLAGCKTYKMEADVNTSALSNIELNENMTISLKNTGLEGDFSVYVLSGESRTSVPHTMVGDDIVFGTTTIGTYVLVPHHTISWTSSGTTNTNMTVYADGVAISSGASVPYGVEITIVPSSGYDIKYAKYNGNTIALSGGQASFVMPDQDAVLDVSVLPQCTVVFDMSGKGNNFSRTYVNGERLGNVQAKASGYDLTGWYTDKKCTTLFPADSAVTRSMTLYAGWEVSPGHTSGYPITTVITGDSPSQAEVDSMISQMKSASSQGQNPYVTFSCDGKLSLPSDLTKAMIEYNARLIYEDKNVRIAMSKDTLAGIGTAPAIELVVTKIDNPTVKFPEGKTGLVYDISLKVDGKDYTNNFVKPLDAIIDISGEGKLNPNTIKLYYINGTTLEEMRCFFSAGTVSFDPPHLSQYAIVYDTTAMVTVDLNGGSLTSKGEGWNYVGGKYTKYFTIGTPVSEVLRDLGQYDMSGSISLSVSSTADSVTSDGLTIQIQWMSLAVLAAIAIIIILVALTVFLTFRRKGTRD